MIFIYGILSKKLYLNRNFYLPILSMFTAAILFCFSVGFIQVASKRGVGTVYITNELLKSFTFEYINIYICKKKT